MRRLSLNRVDDCSANPHGVVINEARVDLYIRDKPTILQDTSVLSHLQDTKLCGFNANTSYYQDRQSDYQNTMLRCNDCEINVHCLLDMLLKQFNGTVEPFKPIAFPIDSDQQESINKSQCNLQATVFDQDIY